MAEHSDTLEADLFEHFGIDILDYYRGILSLRRIWVLIKRLCNMPGRSAVAAAVDTQSEWGTPDYLLAEIIDRLELNNWLLVEINSEKNDIPPPEPIPRPGVSVEAKAEENRPRREFASPTEVAALFAGTF